MTIFDAVVAGIGLVSSVFTYFTGHRRGRNYEREQGQAAGRAADEAARRAGR